MKSDDLESFLLKFTMADFAECKQLFKELCSYSRPEEIENIFEKLMAKRNTLSLYWLREYLVALQRPAAFHKLFLMLQSPYEEARSQARFGIVKINEDVQLDFLIRMLSFPKKEDVLFAVEKVQAFGLSKPVPFLIEKLKQTQDPQIQIALLDALGELRDTRALSALEQFAEKNKGKIQEAALGALTKLAPYTHFRFLKHMLQSKAVSIRLFAYRAILRHRSKRWEKVFVEHFSAEHDVEIQIGILSSLRSIEDRVLFDYIFRLALVEQENERLRMLAESLLRRVKSDLIKGWLFEKARANALGETELALRILSAYPSLDEIGQICREIYSASTQKRVKLAALHALARFEHQENRDFLFKIIKKEGHFSAAAAFSFVEIMSGDDLDRVRRIVFDQGGDRSAFLIQIFLSAFVRLDFKISLPTEITEKIMLLTRSKNDAIRNLAIRNICRCEEGDKVRKLLMISYQDHSKSVRSTAYEELVRILSAEPNRLENTFISCINFKELTGLVRQLFSDVRCGSYDNFRFILKGLFNGLGSLQKGKSFLEQAEEFEVISMICNQATREKTLFIQILENGEWADAQRLILMKALNASELSELEGLKLDFMADQFARSSASVKSEFLIFFQKMAARSRSVEEAVYRELQSPDSNVSQEELREVITAWAGHAGLLAGKVSDE